MLHTVALESALIVLRKLNLELKYDLEVLFLGICSRVVNTCLHKNVNTRVLAGDTHNNPKVTTTYQLVSG